MAWAVYGNNKCVSIPLRPISRFRSEPSVHATAAALPLSLQISALGIYKQGRIRECKRDLSGACHIDPDIYASPTATVWLAGPVVRHSTRPNECRYSNCQHGKYSPTVTVPVVFTPRAAFKNKTTTLSAKTTTQHSSKYGNLALEHP